MPSKYEYIESGIIALVAYPKNNPVECLAVPNLCCSNGGLDALIVKKMIEDYLGELDMAIEVYEPSS